MAYTPHEWADGEDGGTPITAERLNHIEAGVEGAAGSATWGQVSNRPSTFPPATHDHTIANVTGLQAALDALSDRLDAVENPDE